LAQFTLQDTVLVKNFAGYGAQLNQNVYSKVTPGVTDQHLEELKRHVHRLAPRFVRIFFDPRALLPPGTALPGKADPENLMRSFKRTVVELAQSAASSINITWTGGIGKVAPDPAMGSFAEVLADLVENHGATKLRWVTIGNEPNSRKISLDAYTKIYKALHDHLEKHRLGHQIHLMGGDLIGRKNQGDWCHHMADFMADILDAWSIHVYWNYAELGAGKKLPKLDERLTVVHGIWEGCSEAKRKPLYVTEYGVRGEWKVKLAPKKWKILQPEPGTYKSGKPDLSGPRVVDQNITAFQHAWFNILAANKGYHGVVKWDAYFGKYDLQDEENPQEYGLIGKPNKSGWSLRHSYHLMRLFTQTVKPGWNVRQLDGGGGTEIAAAFAAPSGGGLTLIGLDTAGATLNTASKVERSYEFAKLPKNMQLELLYWNRKGGGLLTSAGKLSTGNGNLTVKAPLNSVFALTTVPVDV
jgi:hypothetical protein